MKKELDVHGLYRKAMRLKTKLEKNQAALVEAEETVKKTMQELKETMDKLNSYL